MKNIEKAKERVWKEVQKESGFKVPPDVEAVINEELEESIWEEEDLDYYREAVEVRVRIAKMAAFSSYLPTPKENKQPKKRYRHTVKRRIHLVNFVINYQLGLRPYKRVNQHRINWKAACEAWNKANPDNTYTPNLLNATFYRAVTDSDVQNALFINQLKETMQGLRDALQRNLLTDNALDSIRKLLRVRPEKMPVLVEERWKVILISLEDLLTGIINEETQNNRRTHNQEG